MMKRLIFILLIGLSTNTFAQNAIADLKFEEAETAFNNGNYKTVISKLDEFDKLIGGIKDASLYLRIVSQDKLFNYLLSQGVPTVIKANKDGLQEGDEFLKVDGIETKSREEALEIFKYKNWGDIVFVQVKRGSDIKDIKVNVSIVPGIRVEEKLYAKETNYDELTSLRKYSKAYIDQMASKGLDDKYREIYNINEKLKKYPADKISWLKEKEKIEADKRVAAEWDKVQKEKRIAKLKDYDEKKDQYYREIASKIDAWEYKDGIKIGMDFNELKKSQKDWFNGHISGKASPSLKEEAYSAYNKNYKEHYGDRLDRVKYTEDGKICYYDFSIIRSRYSVKAEIGKTIDKLKRYFGENLVFDEAGDRTMHWYVIKSPYSKNKIVLQTYESNGHSNVNIIKINDISSDLYQIIYNNALTTEDLDKYLGTYSSSQTSSKINITKNHLTLYAKIPTRPETFVLSLKEKDKYYNEKLKVQVVFNPKQDTLIYTYNGEEWRFTKD